MSNLDYSTLAPGIVNKVRAAREAGLPTTDSGDGNSDMGCSIPFPHIAIPCTGWSRHDGAKLIGAEYCYLAAQDLFPNAVVEASVSSEDGLWVVLVTWPLVTVCSVCLWWSSDSCEARTHVCQEPRDAQLQRLEELLAEQTADPPSHVPCNADGEARPEHDITGTQAYALSQVANSIYHNARNHGFYVCRHCEGVGCDRCRTTGRSPRTFSELINHLAHLHSEVSEVFEAARDGDYDIYCSLCDGDGYSTHRREHGYCHKDCSNDGCGVSDDCQKCNGTGKPIAGRVVEELADVAMMAMSIARHFCGPAGQNIGDVIMMKHRYNLTRDVRQAADDAAWIGDDDFGPTSGPIQLLNVLPGQGWLK